MHWTTIANIAASLSAVSAAISVNNWQVGYVNNVSPDGGPARTVIGVNGAFPPPAIHVFQGDTVVINLKNSLPDQNASLHTHGMFQTGSNWADGPPMVTQCDVIPGGEMQYKFIAENVGTTWIHSHSFIQYPDGLRAPFIVHSRSEAYAYDDEITVSLSDWYHTSVVSQAAGYFSIANPNGFEPVPDSALMNDKSGPTFAVKPNSVYRVRFVNMAAFAAFHVWIEGHQMEVIEVDLVDTKRAPADSLFLTPGQRYSVLIRTKATTTLNFPINAMMEQSMFYQPSVSPYVSGYLVYDAANKNPVPVQKATYNDLDDFTLEPIVPLAPVSAGHVFNRDIVFETIGGINYASFNGISYQPPTVPTMFTAISAAKSANPATAFDPTIYGAHTNTEILKSGENVRIIINNYDSGPHPIHVHGHAFQLLARSSAGFFNATTVLPALPANPMRRDVVQVPTGGYVILGFKADNPGVWLMHCHIDWHVVAGLTATIVESPNLIATQYVPMQAAAVCGAAGKKMEGNALGRPNFLDMTGEKPVQRGTAWHHGHAIKQHA